MRPAPSTFQKLTQEEESDLAPDALLLACLFPLLGELFNLRVLPSIQREQEESEDLSSDKTLPNAITPVGLAIQ